MINIVLRPDLDATEITTTYTNALGGYDAPQSSVSLQHGQTLHNDRLHVRFNTTFTRTLPPTGLVNASWRHAQNWNASLDYAWNQCLGGIFELYGRVVYFQRYDLQLLANSPVVDELRTPTSTARNSCAGAVTSASAGPTMPIASASMATITMPAPSPSPTGRSKAATRSNRTAIRRPLSERPQPLAPPPPLQPQPERPAPHQQSLRRGLSPLRRHRYGDWRGRTYSLSLTVTF